MSNFIQKFRIQLVKDGRVNFEKGAVLNSSDIAKCSIPVMAGMDREMFIVFMFDAKNIIIGMNVVSIGCLTTSLVHPREVFKPAILCNTDRVAFAHNHPSGDPTPSIEDIEITKQLVDAGKILGINVLDHVIIGDENNHSSLRSLGYIH